MRISGALLGVSLWSATVLADVPGPKPSCSAPPECVGCFSDSSGAECEANALDAGLVATDCKTGSPRATYFYCPPGVHPTQGCSCGSAGGLFAAGLLAWFGRRRRS